MTSVGIICELNPLHNGHINAIKKAREIYGSDAVLAAVMSGNFTQRGYPAVCDKYIRAEAGIKSGFDLIVELTPPFAYCSAEKFANGAVSILERLCVKNLLFGSESGDTALLSDYAEKSTDPRIKELVKTMRDKSHQTGTNEAFSSVYPDSFFPTTPNDILGCEYLKAIKKNAFDIKPCAYKREDDGFSATLARNALYENADADGFMPTQARVIIDAFKKKRPDENVLFALVSSTLRGENADTKGYDTKGGILGRISSKLDYAKSLEDLVAKSTCAKYSSSRIRRVLLSLCVEKNAFSDDFPKETLLLGTSEKGRAFLSETRKIRTIDVKTSFSDLKYKPETDYIYALCLGESAETLYKKRPYIGLASEDL